MQRFMRSWDRRADRRSGASLSRCLWVLKKATSTPRRAASWPRAWAMCDLPLCKALHKGKTHLMLALGHHACLSGYSAYHLTAREAIEKLLKAREQSRLRKALAWFRKPNVLLLDEVGHEPLTPEQAHVFFQLVNVRYETGSIVITSNRPFSKWAKLMPDEAVAPAMLDRLLHHVQVFSLKADSYRMKERLGVGTIAAVGGSGFD